MLRYEGRRECKEEEGIAPFTDYGEGRRGKEFFQVQVQEAVFSGKAQERNSG